MGSEFDLLVVGDANPDVVLSGAPRGLAYGQREHLVSSGALVLGGSAAITACGAARLGLRTAFAGLVGDDAAGRFVLEELVSRGVDVSHCTIGPEPTAMTVVLADGSDRAILTAPGCLPYLGAGDVPRGLARHVHVSSYFLQPRLAAGLPELFADVRRAGATTSLDTNDDPAGQWPDLTEVLRVTDVFLPNAAEARALSRTGGSLEEAAALLGETGTLVVVKDGEHGALAWDGGDVVRQGPIPVEAVDAVGAGDSFNAGFVAARLRGLPLAECLRVAVRCGGLSTRAAGGTAAQPAWEEL